MAQLVKALRSHRRDPWFESRCAHFTFMILINSSIPAIPSLGRYRRNPMRSLSFSLSTILAAGIFLNVSSSPDVSCVSMESPRTGTVVSAPLCTVAVNACDQVASINFVARYALPAQNRDTTLLLGRITHPPFKLIWNTESVPNQLYKGMTFLIDAALKSGERLSFMQGGIFITNKPVQSPRAAIPFTQNNGFMLFTKSDSRGHATLSVNVSASWARDGIRFLARAATPVIFSSAPKDKLAGMGIEVCIDPSSSRKPYPPPQAFSIAVPLDGTPFRQAYRPVFSSDGSFAVATNREPCKCVSQISKEDGKGFDIAVTVPGSLFGAALPDSFGCNVIVRLPDENGQLVSVPWIGAPESELLSPYAWGTITLLPKPLLSSLWMVWLLSFGAGLLLSLLGGSVYFLIRKRSVSFEQFEQTEEEKNLSDQVYQFIDEAITKKDLSLHWAAEKLGLPPKKVDAVIKKYKEKNFHDYIMAMRIEIAKERLRSSHSSIASIAESCGFKNAGEMEKYFLKFFRTTPLKYRKENQVA
jgi:AraC-like DNA-binding protein